MSGAGRQRERDGWPRRSLGAPRLRRLGRWLAAGFVLALLGPAGAQAATVTVVSANGQTHPVPLEPLLADPDVRDRAYTVRGADGATASRQVTGVSLAAVLAAADARVDQFRYAEVEDGAGASVVFSRDQALDADWPGGRPPVFVADADAVRFLWPADAQGAANELAGPGLTIRLRRKRRLTISAEAATAQPDPGEKVTFTATVGGVAAGEEVTVSWLFGTSGRTAGTTARHAFRKTGTYHVIATATTADDPTGVSDIVTIKVGGAKDDKRHATRETASAGATSAGGTGAGGPGTGLGPAGGQAGGGAGASGSAAGGASPAVTEPATPGRTGRTARRTRGRERERERHVDTSIPGEVEGELLVPEPASATTAPRRMSAARPEASDADARFGLPPEAWTGLGLGAAMLAGWSLERRRWQGAMR